jgi:hypothetical protein
MVACRRGTGGGAFAGRIMPSLVKFLVVVGVIAGAVFGGMWALATFVEPTPREITVTVPPERFAPR